MASIILPNAEATIAFGRTYAATVLKGDLLALTGDLGAGKTHFVQGLAAGLGHEDPVTSPTFTLVHEYMSGRWPLFHFDFYRLKTEAEVREIGFDEYLDGGGIIAIEWADKFPDLLPEATRWLHFRHRDDGTREVEEEG
jgi:tRNA threonylcarbamoyladenosine biosynthesis protein TsaE